MTPSFSLALQAAQQAAAAQHYPKAALYVVATPIGNLADISLRALHVLQLADTIACEDTRHTRQLLNAYGIDKPAAALLAAHQHNERSAGDAIVQRLAQGQRVALVSDAGTPAISDPGALVAQAVQQAGFAVLPIPGASSVTAALSATALAQPPDAPGGYVFMGFLPAKGQMRQAALREVQQQARAVVLLEAPHRITELAQALAELGERRITLARELTKQFEQLHTLPAAEASAWLTAEPSRQRGEFVVIVHPDTAPSQAATPDSPPPEALRLLQLLLAEDIPLKSAARAAAHFTGASRKLLYAAGLELGKTDDAPGPAGG
ncbi:16S rRNA (cytidine(1402)-2'-O)-methyltransferase [Vandammella animalimorsus]|uniref:16S rRNA (cytidine(1402)-2'-O)-methyltransferase n=1 Tax=Vandammella animalimorsus TaxID=2029117 RepID=UPI0031BB1D96